MQASRTLGRTVMALVALLAVACSESPNGPAECAAAGGRCICGPSGCDGGVIGPQDCNPDRNPCGGVCCLPPEAGS